jgi:hypothetical protein
MAYIRMMHLEATRRLDNSCPDLDKRCRIGYRIRVTVGDRGCADGVRDLAMPMTIAIMCEQLGISHCDGEDVEKWSRAYTAQVG